MAIVQCGPQHFVSVHGGQITGVVGLSGSGRRETATIMSGVVKRGSYLGGEEANRCAAGAASFGQGRRCLPEIINRIVVSRLGRIVEEFSMEGATEEKIMYATVHCDAASPFRQERP